MNQLSLDKFLPEAKSTVGKAQSLADKLNHKEVDPVHFLAVAVNLPEILKFLEIVKVDPKILSIAVETEIKYLPKQISSNSSLSKGMLDVLARAEKEAGEQKVSLEHLMFSVFSESKGATLKIIQGLGLVPGQIRSRAKMAETKDTSVGTSFFTNITDLAKMGRLDPVIGRNGEVRRLIQILGRRNKNHPLLVGQPGVGRRSIVNAVAMKIASGNVSAKFLNVNLIHIDAGRLVSGTKQRGEAEIRLRKAISSIKPENTILYIHGIDALFSQGNGASGSGDVLSSLLAQEDLRIITSTTPEGLRKISEKDNSLTHRFTPIDVEPSTEAETIEILRGIAVRYETFHNVQVGDPAICAAVKLAKRYLKKRVLPDSAIDLLDEAASRKKFEVDGLPAKSDGIVNRYNSVKSQLVGLDGDEDDASIKSKLLLQSELQDLKPQVEEILATFKRNKGSTSNCVLNETDVALILEDWTGIPAAKMLDGEGDKLGKMEDMIGARVIGQDEAVIAVSKAIRRARLGLRDVGKPIGSFLFLGSSGVGKTEISKALSEFLFDDDKSMIRIDCSELQHSHMVARLIGPPPGYANASDGGMLTEAVIKKPYSVVLFDEVEKAHPDIFNILLQVLDDGRLTDGCGKTADFTNTVIILTSNIGSKTLLELPPEQFESEEGILEMKKTLQGELLGHLRPEFLNRIDETVIFRPLSKPILNKIADIQLRNLEKMLSSREIKVSVSDEVKSFLVDEGYSPAFGARPLKRSILKHIQDAISERIMKGLTKDGSTVEITMVSNKLSYASL